MGICGLGKRGESNTIPNVGGVRRSSRKYATYWCMWAGKKSLVTTPSPGEARRRVPANTSYVTYGRNAKFSELS